MRELTSAEKNVLLTFMQGNDRQSVAQTLDVNISTVDYHLQNIYRKFATRILIKAIKIAVETGQIPIPWEVKN